MRTKRSTLKNPFILSGKRFLVKQILFVVIAGIFITASSCKKTKDTNVTFKATINGTSETPPNASTATGTAILTFNTSTKMFDLVVTYSGVTATASHIHKGDMGVAGSVVFGFTAPLTSPIKYTSVALDATQEADLNANLYYVNIHSAAFPGGEIRGQLIKQ